MLNETSSWSLWPIHDGKPLPSDHTEFTFEDLAAPVHDLVVAEVFHPRVFAYRPGTRTAAPRSCSLAAATPN